MEKNGIISYTTTGAEHLADLRTKHFEASTNWFAAQHNDTGVAEQYTYARSQYFSDLYQRPLNVPAILRILQTRQTAPYEDAELLTLISESSELTQAFINSGLHEQLSDDLFSAFTTSLATNTQPRLNELYLYEGKKYFQYWPNQPHFLNETLRTDILFQMVNTTQSLARLNKAAYGFVTSFLQQQPEYHLQRTKLDGNFRDLIDHAPLIYTDLTSDVWNKVLLPNMAAHLGFGCYITRAHELFETTKPSWNNSDSNFPLFHSPGYRELTSLSFVTNRLLDATISRYSITGDTFPTAFPRTKAAKQFMSVTAELMVNPQHRGTPPNLSEGEMQKLIEHYQANVELPFAVKRAQLLNSELQSSNCTVWSTKTSASSTDAKGRVHYTIQLEQLTPDSEPKWMSLVTVEGNGGQLCQYPTGSANIVSYDLNTEQHPSFLNITALPRCVENKRHLILIPAQQFGQRWVSSQFVFEELPQGITVKIDSLTVYTVKETTHSWLYGYRSTEILYKEINGRCEPIVIQEPNSHWVSLIDTGAYATTRGVARAITKHYAGGNQDSLEAEITGRLIGYTLYATGSAAYNIYTQGIYTGFATTLQNVQYTITADVCITVAHGIVNKVGNKVIDAGYSAVGNVLKTTSSILSTVGLFGMRAKSTGIISAVSNTLMGKACQDIAEVVTEAMIQK